MGIKCGIVGLPNVGKSTLFNAVTQAQNAAAANYPFCTIDPNVGVVPVPDLRLTHLAAIVESVGTGLEALPLFLQDGAEKAMQALHTRTER